MATDVEDKNSPNYMTGSQVQAAMTLLRKTLPDLVQHELPYGQAAVPFVIRAPAPIRDSKEWEQWAQTKVAEREREGK